MNQQALASRGRDVALESSPAISGHYGVARVKTFLVTHFGKPYTAAGFGNWFRELCDAAGCFDISAHGGRKATARRLAEIGCSANQIAAITGHASLSEVQRYTKAADRKRMAKEAIKKLTEGGW
jgi:integrase